ncbi:putative ribose-phosphate diphosphokinase [Dioscorea sansibarensis]
MDEKRSKKEKIHLFYCAESEELARPTTPSSSIPSWRLSVKGCMKAISRQFDSKKGTKKEEMCQAYGGVQSPFSYFWISGSCPHTVKAISSKAPFEVLSLAVSIADALQI